MRREKKYRLGMTLAIIAIAILVGQEAFGWLLNRLLQLEMSAGDYSRLLFSVPVSIFFFLGHKWALWLFRIGFALGIFASIFLLVVLIDADANRIMFYFSAASLVGYVFGTWIVFGSEGLKSYIRSQRRRRGIYD